MRNNPSDSSNNVISESKPVSHKPKKNSNVNAGSATTAQAEFNLLKHKVDEDEEDYTGMPELIEEECDIPKRSKMFE